MKSVALKRQDVLAGLLFLLFGSAALYFGRTYSMGSAGGMGPGYFPRVLGGLLCVFGLVIAAKGFLKPGPEIGRDAPRSFLVILAVVLFGLLIGTAGLVAAVTALILVGAAADREFRPLEAVGMAAVLCLFSIAVFNWGLGLHLPLWPAW